MMSSTMLNPKGKRTHESKGAPFEFSPTPHKGAPFHPVLPPSSARIGAHFLALKDRHLGEEERRDRKGFGDSGKVEPEISTSLTKSFL